MSRMTPAHLIQKLEAATEFDAESWGEVLEWAMKTRNVMDPRHLAPLRDLIREAQRLFIIEQPDLANHLMLAVAAALVPEGASVQLHDNGDGRGSVAVVTFVHGYQGEATSPANALAAAALRARAALLDTLSNRSVGLSSAT